MNDEIKEILKNVKKCCEIMEDNYFVVYQREDILKLLDYVTSLQKKYENAVADYEQEKFKNNQAIKELKKYIPDDDDTILFTNNQRRKVMDILKGSDKE